MVGGFTHLTPTETELQGFLHISLAEILSFETQAWWIQIWETLILLYSPDILVQTSCPDWTRKKHNDQIPIFINMRSCSAEGDYKQKKLVKWTPAIQVLNVHPGHGGPLTCGLTAAIIIVIVLMVREAISLVSCLLCVITGQIALYASSHFTLTINL